MAILRETEQVEVEQIEVEYPSLDQWPPLRVVKITIVTLTKRRRDLFYDRFQPIPLPDFEHIGIVPYLKKGPLSLRQVIHDA